MLHELLEGTGAQPVNDARHEAPALVAADICTTESSSPTARKNGSESTTTAHTATDSASATDLPSAMDTAAAPSNTNATTVALASESAAAINDNKTDVLPPSAATAVDEHAVVAFVNAGGSVSAAAAKFGLSRTDVSQIVKDAATSLAHAAEHSHSQSSGSGESGGSDPDATEDERDESMRKRKTRDAEPNDDTSAASDASSSALDAASQPKRVRMSPDERLAILRFVELGGSHSAAAEKFGVSRAAVAKVVKEREQIWRSASETTRTSPTVATAAAAAVSAATVAAASLLPGAVALDSYLDPAVATTSSSALPLAAPSFSSSTLSSALMTKRGASPPLPISTTPTAAGAGAGAHRKGKRVRKTNVEKLEILAFVEQGGSQGAAAEKFGVSRTAVTKMVKEKEAIAAQASSESSTHRKVLQYQHKLSIIEDMLYKWQVQVEFEAPSVKVTGELLQTKAMEFRNKILVDFSADLPADVVVSLTDFKASNGWLHRYTQRRNVRSLSKHEHHSIAGDATHVTKRLDAIRAQLTHAPLACIWNIDEAVVRHRTTSGRPDAPVNLDDRSHEKLTVTFGVSAAGEKLALHAIGASSEPASLKDVDSVLACGVAYHAQRKACQDSSTTLHYLNRMVHEARARKQVWYVLLDNCPSHVAAASVLDPTGSYDAGYRVDSVVLLVLPPQSSSGSSTSAQPLQLGVVRSWKLAFRREMLQTILDEYALWQSQATKSIFDVHAVTHTRNALLWLQSAWHTVSATAIRHAWTKSQYLPPHLLAELASDDAEAAQPSLDATVYVALLELLAAVATKRELATVLGLDTVGGSNSEQLALELVSLDANDAPGALRDDAHDDEIVIESLSAQGLIRESQRATHSLLLDASATAAPDIANLSDACATVEKLLRFFDKTSHEALVPATDRRAGRTNLLGLHRILLKARAKERSSTAYTV